MTKITEELRTVRETLEQIQYAEGRRPIMYRTVGAFESATRALHAINRLIPEIEEMEREAEISRQLSCNAPGTTRGNAGDNEFLEIRKEHGYEEIASNVAKYNGLYKQFIEAAPLETSGGEPTIDSSGLRQVDEASVRRFQQWFSETQDAYGIDYGRAESIMRYLRTHQPDPLAFLDSVGDAESLGTAVELAIALCEADGIEPWAGNGRDADMNELPYWQSYLPGALTCIATIKRLAKRGERQ